MRRKGGGALGDCGYLWAGDVTSLRVHIGNILLPPTGECETFATVKELLAKWRVD